MMGGMKGRRWEGENLMRLRFGPVRAEESKA